MGGKNSLDIEWSRQSEVLVTVLRCCRSIKGIAPPTMKRRGSNVGAMPRPCKPANPLRCFHSSPEAIRIVGMMYLRFLLSPAQPSCPPCCALANYPQLICRVFPKTAEPAAQARRKPSGKGQFRQPARSLRPIWRHGTSLGQFLAIYASRGSPMAIQTRCPVWWLRCVTCRVMLWGCSEFTCAATAAEKPICPRPNCRSAK